MKTKSNDLAFVNELRTGTDEATIARAFLDNLHYMQGCTLINASKNDLYMALSYTVRDRIFNFWFNELEAFKVSKTEPD